VPIERGPIGIADQPARLWTEGEVAELRWLVGEGRPVAEIARRLRRPDQEVRGVIRARQLWPFPGRNAPR
jgi:hypothetical protein